MEDLAKTINGLTEKDIRAINGFADFFSGITGANIEKFEISCDYCKKQKNLKDFGYETNSYYKIIGNKLEHKEVCIDDYYSYTDEIPINYCPMCGRKLG